LNRYTTGVDSKQDVLIRVFFYAMFYNNILNATISFPTISVSVLQLLLLFSSKPSTITPSRLYPFCIWKQQYVTTSDIPSSCLA